jgi:hypothetical protein
MAPNFCSMGDELLDDGRLKVPALDQVFFVVDALTTCGKCFAADQALFINGTFETNRLSLVPLVVLVGLTNTGKTFPSASF